MIYDIKWYPPEESECTRWKSAWVESCQNATGKYINGGCGHDQADFSRAAWVFAGFDPIVFGEWKFTHQKLAKRLLFSVRIDKLIRYILQKKKNENLEKIILLMIKFTVCYNLRIINLFIVPHLCIFVENKKREY